MIFTTKLSGNETNENPHYKNKCLIRSTITENNCSPYYKTTHLKNENNTRTEINHGPHYKNTIRSQVNPGSMPIINNKVIMETCTYSHTNATPKWSLLYEALIKTRKNNTKQV